MAIAVRGSYSPWGKIQYTKTIADGIVFVSTSSHGGIKLSRQRQFEMPNSLRVKGGWYEEDCECSLVVLGFPQYFDKDQKEHAVKSVKNWFPEKYEEFTGTFVPVEESIVKNNKKFEQDNINNYVAVAAWGDWHERVPQGMVAVLAKKANDEKFFLVPAKEYTGRFVIDLNKYKEIKFLP